MKILHAADLHIDSPLRGLSRYEGAPAEDLRKATRGALENLVRLAVELPVDAVLLAGDVYDGTWPGLQTGLFFVNQMARLGGEGIAVFLVSGNHDAQNRTMRDLRMPGNVHTFATDHAETKRKPEIGLSVHGQGFARWDLRDNLAVGYPPADAGLFNVGLLHTALEGSPDHQKYAPCSVSDLEARGYDYWALGHIHEHRIVREEPWIVYPGNLQGRHARETGPKGCVLVTVDDTTLKVRSVESRELHTARWEHLRVDLTGATDTDQALSLVEQGFQGLSTDGLVAVRVTLTGRSAVHTDLWRDQERMRHELRAAAGHHDHLWLEKVKFRTTNEDVDEADVSGVLSDIRRTLEGFGASPDMLVDRLVKHPIIGRLPSEDRERGELDLTSAEWLRRLTEDAFDLAEVLLKEAR